MSRGDRSRGGRERTAEERERDRQERARQRALKDGAPDAASAPGQPADAAAGAPGDLAPSGDLALPGEMALPEDLAASGDAAADAPRTSADPVGPYAYAAHRPVEEPPDSGFDPLQDPPDAPAAADLLADVAGPATVEYLVTDALGEPDVAAHEPEVAAHEPEVPAHESEAPAHEPEAQVPAHEVQVPAHELEVAREPARIRPEPHGADADAGARHGEPFPAGVHSEDADAPLEPAVPVSLAAAGAAGRAARAARAEQRAKRAPRGRGAKVRPGAVAVGEPRTRSRRSPVGRLVAVLALVVAVVAVILLIKALGSSEHAKKAAVTPGIMRVVIPEGKTRLQIALIASHAGLHGSYRGATKHSKLLDPAQYGAPRGTPNLEGFLFPATYEEYLGAPVSRLVSEQLLAFKENFGAQQVARARALHVTPYQVLIVASMIEREAQVPGDRAKIAAVIYNRLRREIPLGIDATIYYAVELQKNVATYTGELTESQLHIVSPYNTRTNVGLPPTPIANPGLASIEAAANPANAPYLYYVAGADGCGEQVFSRTLADFETHVSAYQAAVKANGGHPPTCKKK